MDPMVSAGEITDIALDGVKRFAPGSTLYIRPMFYLDGSLDVLMPDPESTRFVLTLFEAPMPSGNGFACCLSSFRRPTPETAPTDPKARKRVGSGQSVSVRVALGGRRFIKKKKNI